MHVRSAIIKTIFAIVLTIALGAHASEVGRYQFIVNSQYRSESVLLDTQTGKMWQRQCVVEGKGKDDPCEYSAWVQLDIEGITKTNKEIMNIYRNGLSRDSKEQEKQSYGSGIVITPKP